MRAHRLDPLRRGGVETPGDPDHCPADFDYEETAGRHLCAPDGGLARPINIVENMDEIEMLFRDRPQPTIVCGYCGSTYRTRDEARAETWWRAHECPPLQEIEAGAIVYDLKPLLEARRAA